MNVRGRFAPKLLLWASLAILIILAAVGLLFFDRLVPRKHSVTFSFAGWTNDAQGGRVAMLAISNRSHAPVMYFADRYRQPRCEITMLISRQRQGNHEHTIYSNVTARVWDGYLPLQLPAQSRVDCLLPWLDEYSNGQITFMYLPEPDLIQRMHEKIGPLLGQNPGRRGESIPLAGAPWTNALVIPLPGLSLRRR